MVSEGFSGGMAFFRLPRLPTLAVLCGSVLFGCSLGGVAAVDTQVGTAAAAPGQVVREHLVSGRVHDHDHGRHEL